MKIMFAAPFSGARTSIFISEYYASLSRAATTLGHEIKLHDTREIIASSKISPFLRKAYLPFAGIIERLRLMSLLERKLQKDLMEAVEKFRPEVLFIYVINTQSLSSIIKTIRKRGIIVVMWVGLNPNVLSRGAKSILPELDCVFYYDYTYKESFFNLGCRRVEIVPMGIDVNRFDAVNKTSNIEPVDVSFVGMIDDSRRKLLGALQGVNLGIWSWNVDPDDSVLRTFLKGEASGDKAIKILKASRISVNIHRDFEHSGGNYRLFEIPASGALQLVDNKPMIPKYFTPEKEIIVFDGPTDLRGKIDYFLSHESERTKIAKNARLRLEREHGMVDRFQRMEKILNKL
jgi:spore maturation protein CgeB